MAFSVNVEETLSMTVTDPSEAGSGEEGWAQGDVNKFLRNKVHVAVSSNSAKGYTAGMYTKQTATNLTHTTLSSYTLPTLSNNSTCADANCEAFPKNAWGYSLDDDTNTGTYKAMVGATATPITVLSSATNASGEEDVYFGAKADGTKASGTYKADVVFTVTAGTEGSPLSPATPSDPGNPDQPGPSYDGGGATNDGPQIFSYTTNDRTYRSYASDTAVATTETGTQKKSTIDDFVTPLGALERNSEEIQDGSPITRIMMCVAFAAAGVGLFFFILAKRRKEDDEEEQIQ